MSPPNAENYAALGGVPEAAGENVEFLKVGRVAAVRGDASPRTVAPGARRRTCGTRSSRLGRRRREAVRLVEACAARSAPQGGYRPPCRATADGRPEARVSPTRQKRFRSWPHTDAACALVTFDAGACGRLEFEVRGR